MPQHNWYYYILSTDLYKHSAQFLLLRGRCLNIAPEFSQTAEECLSRAVKLEPGLVEGWNTLGEQFWKKRDLTAAKTCFTGAQQQVSLYYSQEQWGSFIKCAYTWYNQSSNSYPVFLESLFHILIFTYNHVKMKIILSYEYVLSYGVYFKLLGFCV